MLLSAIAAGWSGLPVDAALWEQLLPEVGGTLLCLLLVAMVRGVAISAFVRLCPTVLDCRPGVTAPVSDNVLLVLLAP